MNTTASIELKDIQGIILRGYGNLRAARFFLLCIEDRASAKRWLAKIVGDITAGKEKPSRKAINVAFTLSGLNALALSAASLESFSREFQEGMVTDHRMRILGDHGSSDPVSWDWGGPGKDRIDVFMLVYAENNQELDDVSRTLKEQFAEFDLSIVRVLETHEIQHRKEHFGFHDGIAQPGISGMTSGQKIHPDNIVASGEFILGYPNQYDKYPDSPIVSSREDPGGILPNATDGSGQKDFGRNGSYLVFRQLSQNVPAFWKFVDDAAKGPNGASNIQARIKLASKMVGRWPSGTPLVLSADQDNPNQEERNNFMYAKRDPDGNRCPIGSHIRRSNPRDSMEPDPESSLTVANRHRILRRGRSYGTPIFEMMTQNPLPDAEDSANERGLYFICFNESISRQFEFIQQTWVNNPKFEGLYNDPDPITGDQEPGEDGSLGAFTMQASPIRRRVNDVPRFVQVRGGAYFFMPGIRALRYLASLP